MPNSNIVIFVDAAEPKYCVVAPFKTAVDVPTAGPKRYLKVVVAVELLGTIAVKQTFAVAVFAESHTDVAPIAASESL